MNQIFFKNVKQVKVGSSDQATGICPFHDDHNPSFSFNLKSGLWICHAGCGSGNANDFATMLGTPTSKPYQAYVYTDEDGVPLFEVRRYEPKKFSIYRIEGEESIPGLENTRRVLYGLPRIANAQVVYIFEGEKDCDLAKTFDLVATTNPMGAGKWRSEYSESLSGKEVIVVPDQDQAGKAHADKIVKELQGFASRVKRVDLPEGKDFSEWVARGGSLDEFKKLVADAPPIVLSSETRGNDPWQKAELAFSYVSQCVEEHPWIVRDVVAPNAITAIMSPRGTGKTHFTHALAIAIANGGSFRGFEVQKKRVLLIDRDNSKAEVQRRLKLWGVNASSDLRILGRDEAPDLNKPAVWDKFPVEKYDVVIIDSIGSSTEGIGDNDTAESSKAISIVLNLARKGPAVLLLGNTKKDAKNYRGSGTWADRIDILYEVRDATGFIPTGKKSWWEELPPGGESDWGAKASRRKKREDYRLAFVPSKFRIGIEPDPWCIQITLSDVLDWELIDITDELVEEGESNQRTQRESIMGTELKAIALVKSEIAASSKDSPIKQSDAEELIVSHRIGRKRAREIIKEGIGHHWRMEVRKNERGSPKILLAMDYVDNEEKNNRDENIPIKTVTYHDGFAPACPGAYGANPEEKTPTKLNTYFDDNY